MSEENERKELLEQLHLLQELISTHKIIQNAQKEKKSESKHSSREVNAIQEQRNVKNETGFAKQSKDIVIRQNARNQRENKNSALSSVNVLSSSSRVVLPPSNPDKSRNTHQRSGSKFKWVSSQKSSKSLPSDLEPKAVHNSPSNKRISPRRHGTTRTHTPSRSCSRKGSRAERTKTPPISKTKFKLVIKKQSNDMLATKYKLIRKTRKPLQRSNTLEGANSRPACTLQKLGRYKLVKKIKEESWSERHRIQSVKKAQLIQKMRFSLDKSNHEGQQGWDHSQNRRHHHRQKSKLISKHFRWKAKHYQKQKYTEPLTVNQLLDRSIENASQNKYKFIKQKQVTKSPRRTKRKSLKIDRRSSNEILNERRRKALLNRSTKSFRSHRYRVFNKSTGNYQSLKRTRYSLTNISFDLKSVFPSNKESTKIVAGHSLQKSITVASSLELRKKRQITEKKYCLFYNRFGKCNRGEKCHFIHDASRIAICTRYLRGTCKVTDCPFSHTVAAEKVPACMHFLRGTCNRSHCPYRHVNVGPDADICQDFIRGFCAKADKCKLQHVLICPEWQKSGLCSKKRKCGLLHPKKKVKDTRNNSAKDSSTLSGTVDCKKVQVDPNPVTLNDPKSSSSTLNPSTSRSADQDALASTATNASSNILPSYISLSKSSPTLRKPGKNRDMTKAILSIRPNL